ncbi:MAG: heavy-metal-associated domain-containing protein [Saprospiraceae bacterium]
MEKQLKFKTNINCNNCIRTVSGFLNEVGEIKRWEVDTANPEKILTVEGDEVTAEAVIEAVEEAGFDIKEVEEVRR